MSVDVSRSEQSRAVKLSSQCSGQCSATPCHAVPCHAISCSGALAAYWICIPSLRDVPCAVCGPTRHGTGGDSLLGSRSLLI